ncbi:MAG: hypothetical protein GY719_26250 [bacterium]|nr:hypothetical protein [bacterium]
MSDAISAPPWRGALVSEPVAVRLPATLTEHLEGLQLRHFSPDEIIRACGGGEPPWHLWGNIVPTLIVADAAREAIGRPTKITSAWRSDEYNWQNGGKEYSQHPTFTALDLAVLVGSWKARAQRELQDLLASWRGRRFFSPVPFKRVEVDCVPFAPLDTCAGCYSFIFEGGIGRYPAPGWPKFFTHLDTRGIRADWGAR